MFSGISSLTIKFVSKFCHTRSLKERSDDGNADSLPQDVWLKILSQVDAESLVSVQRTCRTLRELAGDPALPGWQTALQRRIDNATTSTAIITTLKSAARAGIFHHAERLAPAAFLSDAGASKILALLVGTVPPKLRVLSLHIDGPATMTVQGIADNAQLRGLRHLNLSHCRLSVTEAVIIAGAAPLAGIEHLDLRDNALADEAVYHLTRDHFGNCLRTLLLDRNRICSQGWNDIFEARHWTNLQSLSLAGNSFSSIAAATIANAAHLTKLTRLDLRQANAPHELGRALGNNTSLRSIVSLDLSDNRLGESGAYSLVSKSHWEALTYLSLRNNLIGPFDHHFSSAISALTSLRHLDFTLNNGESVPKEVRWLPPDSKHQYIVAFL